MNSDKARAAEARLQKQRADTIKRKHQAIVLQALVEKEREQKMMPSNERGARIPSSHQSKAHRTKRSQYGALSTTNYYQRNKVAQATLTTRSMTDQEFAEQNANQIRLANQTAEQRSARIYDGHYTLPRDNKGVYYK